jgi:hypothetical protein
MVGGDLGMDFIERKNFAACEITLAVPAAAHVAWVSVKRKSDREFGGELPKSEQQPLMDLCLQHRWLFQKVDGLTEL